MRDLSQAVSRLNLPSDVRVEYGGLYAEQQKSFRDLAMVFISAMMGLTMVIGIVAELGAFYWSCQPTSGLIRRP